MWAIQAGRHTRGQIRHASRGPRLKRFALRMRKTRTCVQPCARMPNRADLLRIGKLRPIMWLRVADSPTRAISPGARNPDTKDVRKGIKSPAGPIRTKAKNMENVIKDSLRTVLDPVKA